MNLHRLIVIDIIVGFAIMEAIIKPVTVRITQNILRWLDSHVDWIPDWLYHPSK